MTTLDDDGENGNVGGIYSGDTRSLGECFGSELLELLAAFESDSLAGVIVEPGGDADRFILLGPRGRDFLLTNVTSVMVSDPELLDDGSRLVGWERKSVQMLTSECMNLVKRAA